MANVTIGFEREDGDFEVLAVLHTENEEGDLLKKEHSKFLEDFIIGYLSLHTENEVISINRIIVPDVLTDWEDKH